MNDDSSHPPAPLRQRVSKACENCRSLKTKCDGVQPICGRCKGYGNHCTYPKDRKRPRDAADIDELGTLRDACRAYDQLVTGLLTHLPTHEKQTFDIKRICIRRCLSTGVLEQLPQSESPAASHSVKNNDAAPQNLSAAQRYLGEASDIKFFNVIKHILRDVDSPDQADEEGFDSYEQNAGMEDRSTEEVPLDYPRKERADVYVNTYFETIHVAYPFICESDFRKEYAKLWNIAATDVIDAPWMGLFFSIFALGARYMSISSSPMDEDDLHERYFQRSETLADRSGNSASAHTIAALLSQCFYLLATCRTDRAWAQLGIIIRISQSVGLHVDQQNTHNPQQLTVCQHEIRRRLWYSIYVLDRLLALQLGRPAAIQDPDYDVILPTWLASEVGKDKSTENLGGLSSGNDIHVIDYFLSVIQLSHIIGRVIRELYGPKRVSSTLFGTISSLDNDLLRWRSQLKRKLRFDLGHIFETSVTFQKQRNMLAIKYHHLRALIHRPVLCLAYNQSQAAANETSEILGSQTRCDELQNTCIAEARNTARLLHQVKDKKDLVHNFPWWQMISCLVCASSILVIANTFSLHGMDSSMTPTESSSLDEDTETCLAVLDALSLDFNAAADARNMIRRLQGRALAASEAKARQTSTSATNTSQVSNEKPNDNNDAEMTAVDAVDAPSFAWAEFPPLEGDWSWADDLTNPLTWTSQGGPTEGIS